MYFFRPAKVAASTTDKYNVFADAFKEDPFSTTSPFNSNSNSSDPFKPSSEDPFGGATTGTNGVPDDPFGAGANDPFKSSTTDPFASKAFSNQSGAFSFFSEHPLMRVKELWIRSCIFLSHLQKIEEFRM